MNVVFEGTATVCNILSNVMLLYRTCGNAKGTVPIAVVTLQVIANLSWLTFAAMSRDWFLFSTAFSSMTMQLITIHLLRRSRIKTGHLLGTSDPELPQV